MTRSLGRSNAHFRSEQALRNYRGRAAGDYTFHEALAPGLHGPGVHCAA